MSLRVILVLLTTALWFLFCHYRYTCVHKAVFWGCAPTEVVQKDNPVDNTPGTLTFSGDSDKATTTGNFQALADSILRGNTNDNLLEITGFYYQGEQAPDGFENMGLARANQVKDLLAGKIQDERIRISGQLKDGVVPTDPFSAVNFSWKVIDVKKSEVVKTADGAKIYFPVNSAQKINDPDIDAYLEQVAKRVKASGEKINLTGHTDNQGSDASNQTLGMNRANTIRNILKSYGVPQKQMMVASKGESKPIANNETEEGRYQNRRVELDIVK